MKVRATLCSIQAVGAVEAHPDRAECGKAGVDEMEGQGQAAWERCGVNWAGACASMGSGQAELIAWPCVVASVCNHTR